jgi:hypothetical protein
VKHATLHVVAVYDNPMNWQSRYRLAHAFIEHMKASPHVELTFVDCARGDHRHAFADVEGIRHVPVRARGDALIWSKECLVNIGLGRLPDDARFIMNADSDIHFVRPDWSTETLRALQRHPVVMPWGDAVDLGPQCEIMETHRSLGAIWYHQLPVVQGPKVNSYTRFGHPGYATAWRREVLDATGGLPETPGLGAGDHHAMMACIGKLWDTIPNGMTEGYTRPLVLWEQRAKAVVRHNLGYVPGTILHSFHGAKKGPRGRRYIERWKVLQEHRFCPQTHVVRNASGVLELCNNAPYRLRHDVDLYFSQRCEDATTAE